MEYGKVRTAKGQYKKLTDFCGIWSKLSFVGDRVKNGKHYISLNVYGGDYQKNIDYIRELRKNAPFPEKINLFEGYREYAPEMKTLTLVLDIK